MVNTLVVVRFDPVVELTKATAFRTVYGISPSVALVGLASPDDFGKLNNSGETVELLKPEDPGNPLTGFLLVDRVAYDDAAPWPTDADGTGDSLTRTITTNFASFAASWVAASPTPGSTVFPFPIPGDMNGDGLVNLGDVATIVQALVNRSAFDAAHPTVNADTIGDVDGSGTFDLGNLAAFAGLFNPPPPASASAPASANASAMHAQGVATGNAVSFSDLSLFESAADNRIETRAVDASFASFEDDLLLLT